MTKILAIPSEKSMISDCLSSCDGIILGIQGLSVNLPFYIELKDLEGIKKTNKKLFIMLNKNMHNHDLKELEEIMRLLEDYPIDGVFYYDISVVHLGKKLNVSYPLIWSQEHLATNAETCNFWKNQGVSGAYLSNEITLDEIKEIRKQTDFLLFVCMFGYLPMFDSRRHLVKNYLESFKLDQKGDQYYLEKEGQMYPIVDDMNGTTVYSSHILNAIEEYFILKDIHIDYVILNGFHMEPPIFKQIMKLVSTMTEENKPEVCQMVDSMCQNNVDKGFLYKETVYKIKEGK